MEKYCLTIMDVTGIQNYIFGSNQLKQNAGASYLVDNMTTEWISEMLPAPHNFNIVKQKPDYTSQTIDTDLLHAEVIYSGGGNAVILFKNKRIALQFSKKLTQRALVEMPGLKLVISHVEFDWKTDALGGPDGIMNAARQILAKRKYNRPASFPLPGMGITATDAFTGSPAVRYEKQRLYSAEAVAKRDAADPANQRLRKLFKWNDYHFPMQFEDFGEKDESSYIAIVHVDGNGIGKRVESIRNRFPKATDNRNYIQAMRDFSVSLQDAASTTFQKTLDYLMGWIVKSKDTQKYLISGNKLPIRPIVIGGDDITFVTDGRLGLRLAAKFLEEFSSQRLSDDQKIFCRAGVAVVKTHFPFARGYALSEALAQSAKKFIITEMDGGKGTAMDWHFMTSGIMHDLKTMRDREYAVKSGSLLMRPIEVTSTHFWRNWDVFSSITRAFQEDSDWKDKRNKVKQLREVLRRGPEDVKHFLKVFRIRNLPEVQGRPDMKIQGWQGGRCGYFDAIEALDLFDPMK